MLEQLTVKGILAYKWQWESRKMEKAHFAVDQAVAGAVVSRAYVRTQIT
jgi:hypothetical protein